MGMLHSIAFNLVLDGLYEANGWGVEGLLLEVGHAPKVKGLHQKSV